MDLKRLWRHLITDIRSVRRAFPVETLRAIEVLIADGERRHGGELRFAVESALPFADLQQGLTPQARALAVFSTLRMWDTDHRNGVLVYVLLADRAVEIIADRGIHAHVGEEVWRQICLSMEAAFREGHFREGSQAGLTAINSLLISHFPSIEARRNELPDAPVILG